jgi:hypothetical protein
VALALKLARPTVLLAAAPAASAFFRTIAGRGMLHEVQTPESVIELIEQQLGIARRRS